MKIKTFEVEGRTYAEMQDGKPVYVQDDGKEFFADVPGMYSKVVALTGEAASHRKAKEAAESKLKDFEGITDADAAKKALETVANLDSGQLMTAGKVDEIKAAAVKAANEQVAAAQKAANERVKELEGINAKITGDFYAEKVGGAFTRSTFVKEKVSVPSDMLQAKFGQNFKVEEGKTIGYDASGNKIYSRARPGEIADFDEALEMMIDSYADRDNILKGTGQRGTGARESNNNNGNGGKTITRAEFDAKSPMEKASLAKEITARTVTVVD